MEEQLGHPYDLLSGFYTSLWARLDGLFEEHRWMKNSLRDPATIGVPEALLKELRDLQGTPLPLSLDWMESENKEVQDYVERWKNLKARLAREPDNQELCKEIDGLHKRIREKLALFEERALAFASLL